MRRTLTARLRRRAAFWNELSDDSWPAGGRVIDEDTVVIQVKCRDALPKQPVRSFSLFSMSPLCTKLFLKKTFYALIDKSEVGYFRLQKQQVKFIRFPWQNLCIQPMKSQHLWIHFNHNKLKKLMLRPSSQSSAVHMFRLYHYDRRIPHLPTNSYRK